MRRAGPVASLGVALALASCDGIDADAGADASMRIDGAQFRRGTPPAATPGAPEALSVRVVSTRFTPGAVGKPLGGALGAGATAALVSLAGDRGYWIVPAGAAAVDTPKLPSYSASLAFARGLPLGAYDLEVRAVDADGRVGPARVQPLVAASTTAPSKMTITLSWDTEADLDLHVVDPSGVEIFARNVNAVEPPAPGQAPDPTAYERGAYLDFDSNARCVIDGLRRERVVWPVAPAKGRYVVRVDAASMCAEVAARWRVSAELEGRVLGQAEGVSTATDVRFAHDRGAGVLALEVDVP